MKKRYIIIALATVSLTAVGCSLDAQPTNVKTGNVDVAQSTVQADKASGDVNTGVNQFSSDRFGYTFNYPTKWRLQQTPDGSRQILSNGQEKDISKPGVVVAEVGMLVVPVNADLKKYLTLSLQAKKNASAITEGRTANGSKVYSFTFESDNKGREKVFAVEKGLREYLFLYAKGNVNDIVLQDIIVDSVIFRPKTK